MAFSLAQLFAEKQSQQYALHQRYINSTLARVQGMIGFDKIMRAGEEDSNLIPMNPVSRFLQQF